jgi:hypothetical protein
MKWQSLAEMHGRPEMLQAFWLQLSRGQSWSDRQVQNPKELFSPIEHWPAQLPASRPGGMTQVPANGH